MPQIRVLRCGRVRVPRALRGAGVHEVAARPGRDDVDPLLDEATRLVVLGADADLAAVLLRLLRSERLDVEVAYVPSGRSIARRRWGLPLGPAAARLALGGTARPTPLIRDDHGGVLIGAATLTGVDGQRLRGEAYVDNTRLFLGRVRQVVVRAGDDGVAGRVPPGPWVTGRALQLGCTGCRVSSDGVAAGPVLPRVAFYRHTADWLLVRVA